MLNSKNRNYLTKMAHDIKAEVYVGRNGISENVIESAKENIKSNELLKVKVHKDGPIDKHEAAEKLSEELDAELVRVMGNIVILFKKAPKNSEYNLPE